MNTVNFLLASIVFAMTAAADDQPAERSMSTDVAEKADIEESTSGPQPRMARFFPKEYQPYGQGGRSEIVGQAFLIGENGERVPASRRAVFMNPITTYSFEWYTRSIMNGETLEPADKRADEYHWVVRSDSQGNFRIPNVPAGDYYIGCRVLPDEQFVHAEIKVGESETVDVILARDRGSDGAHYSAVIGARPSHAESHIENVDFGSPHSNAPSELAQWAQLVGVWDCTIPVLDGEGGRRFAKATWTWTYAIGGNAVADSYVGHNPKGSNFHGGALRVFNPSSGEWEVAWLDSGARPDDASTMFKAFLATYEDGTIVMRKTDGDSDWRTTFYNITEESYDWINEPSNQRMHCRCIARPER